MSRDNLVSLLHKKGLKATPQRIAIYDILQTCENHPTAEMIYQEVSKKVQGVSKATVYKTLNLFQELGLLIDLGDQNDEEHHGARYEICPSPHINLICRNCGKITDYDSEELEKLYQDLIDKLQMMTPQPRFDIFYTCEECL